MGLCPKSPIPFLLDTKKESKKVKALPASLEELSFDDFPINRDKLAYGSNRKDFLTPSSLVFRLTGLGQPITNRAAFLFKLQNLNIVILFFYRNEVRWLSGASYFSGAGY